MKIAEILRQEMIIPNLGATDKEGVVRQMAAHICSQDSGPEVPEELVVKALLERERLGSTGVGEGVAIPHAKIPGLESLIAAFGRSRQGVDFEAIDQQPVRLICMLLVPENSAGTHLKALARISRLLKHGAFREHLLEAGDQEAIYRAFLEEDSKY